MELERILLHNRWIKWSDMERIWNWNVVLVVKQFYEKHVMNDCHGTF